MKRKGDLISASGPRTRAVLVNKRVAVTYHQKKNWIGLLIDFSDGTIRQQRLKTKREAKDFLEPRRAPRERAKIGIDKVDLIVQEGGQKLESIRST